MIVLINKLINNATPLQRLHYKSPIYMLEEYKKEVNKINKVNKITTTKIPFKYKCL